jgi:hypothetical protein
LVVISFGFDSIFPRMAFISASRRASICSIYLMWRYNYIMQSIN